MLLCHFCSLISVFDMVNSIIIVIVATRVFMYAGVHSVNLKKECRTALDGH